MIYINQSDSILVSDYSYRYSFRDIFAIKAALSHSLAHIYIYSSIYGTKVCEYLFEPYTSIL